MCLYVILNSTIFRISLINLDFDTTISKVRIVIVELFILLLNYELAIYLMLCVTYLAFS